MKIAEHMRETVLPGCTHTVMPVSMGVGDCDVMIFFRVTDCATFRHIMIQAG